MPTPVPLGLDVYSLRTQGWTPAQILDYCAGHGVQVVHFSEIRLLGGLDPDHLHTLRSQAADLGLTIEIGMLSISPSASIFDPARGPAEDQLHAMIDAAVVVGSSLVRCVVGRFPDRRAEGGIRRRIDDALAVLARVRTHALDAGVKIAVENHAGDMQARELQQLVEAAGPEVVGVCIDSGNALWSLEDPRAALERLAPYVVTSHVRDGRVWKTADGMAAQWTRMGDGTAGMGEYVRDYVTRCPGRPLSLEVIVQDQPRLFDYRQPEFWDAYEEMPARDFMRFLDLVDRGTPPAAREPAVDPAAREREDVEASLQWTRETLARLLAE